MAKKVTTKEKAIKAALALAAEKGWENTSLQDVADKIKISLHELHDYFEDKIDILSAYGSMIDRKILDIFQTIDEAATPRDRLFDILMERFDIINEDRDAVKSILRSFCSDPKRAVIGLPHLGKSMSWMLETAGIDSDGIKGAIKIIGLTAIYLKTLKCWVDDDSEDMAKTMAALDKNLGRAEEWAGRFGIS